MGSISNRILKLAWGERFFSILFVVRPHGCKEGNSISLKIQIFVYYTGRCRSLSIQRYEFHFTYSFAIIISPSAIRRCFYFNHRIAFFVLSFFFCTQSHQYTTLLFLSASHPSFSSSSSSKCLANSYALEVKVRNHKSAIYKCI